MFRKNRLDNGMTVLTERMANVRSVCLGIWVKVGSRNEPSSRNGISHFLEHMFFKGTKRRSAADIAQSIDSLGGDLNAFTTKEGTTFYVKVLDEHLEKGVELLADLFMNSTFPEGEVEKEKGVIREEISMVEDTPDDFIHDLFSASVWGGEGLGRPVLGTSNTVSSFNRQDLVGHTRRYYGSKDSLLSCAGRFNQEELYTLLNGKFSRLRKGASKPREKRPGFTANVKVSKRDLSEAHICFGIEGIAQSSDERYAALLLNTVLGGGVSSRLFQEIREKRGLVYSVYSYLSSYVDTGLWGVYAGTAPDNAAELIECVVGEFGRLHRTLSEDELQRAKDQVKGNIMLALESTSRRMQNIATQEIYYGTYFSPHRVIKAIDAVTLGQARDIAERLTLGKQMAMTVLGPVDEGIAGKSPLLLS